MNKEELKAARRKVMEDWMSGDRRFLLKEYGMDAAERFWLSLLHNQEIGQLPESYQYLYAIEYLMGKSRRIVMGAATYWKKNFLSTMGHRISSR